MTGLAPQVSGIFNNHQPFRPVLPDCVTLPQQFIQHGYRVVMGGKLFHLADAPSEPETLTFDVEDLKISEAGRLAGFNSPVKAKWGPVDRGDNVLIDGQLTEQAAEVVGQAHDHPFFLGLGLYAPHWPWFAPEKYFVPFPPDEISLPLVKKGDIMDIPRQGKWMGFGLRYHKPIVKSGQWTFAVASYLACIHYLDAMLGRVFDALANGPNGDNTIVVLWSDHGFLLGEKSHWSKFVLWERATRIPLLIHDPRSRAGGTRCNKTVGLVNLYPTLLELCGLAPEPEVSGTSLVPLIDNPESPWNLPALTSTSLVSHSLRTDRWRFIRYGDGEEELYDHDTDPNEWNNLAADGLHADVRAELGLQLPSPEDFRPPKTG